MTKISKELIEEIAENSYGLLEANGKILKGDLIKKLELSESVVGPTLIEMESQGYLKLTDAEIQLLPKGRKLGRKIVRKHRLLERFLHNVLGLEKEDVHSEACKLEHALSDEAEEALDKFLNHPRECPDDNKPIPPACPQECDCTRCSNGGGGETVSLTNLEPGIVGKVRSIQGGRRAVQRLQDMGLVPNVCVTILKKAPFKGPLELEVCGTKLALGRNIAAKVMVEVC